MTQRRLAAQVFVYDGVGYPRAEAREIVVWTCRGQVYLMNDIEWAQAGGGPSGSSVHIVPFDPRSMKLHCSSYALSHYKYTLPSDKELLELAGTACVVPKGTFVDLLRQFFEYEVIDLLS